MLAADPGRSARASIVGTIMRLVWKRGNEELLDAAALVEARKEQDIATGADLPG